MEGCRWSKRVGRWSNRTGVRRYGTVIPSEARDLGRMRCDQSWVYILSSTTRVLYTGCTSDLLRRMYQHKNGLIPGFTNRYSVRGSFGTTPVPTFLPWSPANAK